MGSRRTILTLPALILFSLLTPDRLGAQEADRIWGRVATVSGEIQEGFIRWDRNEGSWADVLDGSKKSEAFKFQDWWKLAYPEDRHRNRVIELGGYRITWDDDEPDFPTSRESGVRFGHVRSLEVVGGDTARLELRSGAVVDLHGGSTDLGTDLRGILVRDRRGRVVELEWNDLQRVEFMEAPPGTSAGDRRLHGTVHVRRGPSFTGYISWDVDKILTSDTLEGDDSGGRRRRIPFDRVTVIRPERNGSVVTLQGGERVELFGTEDVTSRNDGIQISDPGLGQVELDWEEVESARFHPAETPVGTGEFDGGRRLRGTVVTADSTELTGWIRWDADEEFTWELLDGYAGGVRFDVEFGKIASIERRIGISTAIEVGPTGVNVQTESVEGVEVTLWDGRTFELAGSNDVNEDNDGIFVLPEGSGTSPDDEETEWVMVRWRDFRAARFDRGEGP